MRRIIYILALLFYSAAHASFPVQNGYYTNSTNIHYPGVNYSSANEACNVAVGLFTSTTTNPDYAGRSYYYSYVSNTEGKCYYKQTTVSSSGTSTDSNYNLDINIRSGICPSNSTKSGSTCSCNAGYVENGNQCVQETPPCDRKNSSGQTLDQYCSSLSKSKFNFSAAGRNTGMTVVCQAAEETHFGVGDGSSGTTSMFPGCNRGCMGTVQGDPWAASDDQDKWITKGQASYAGSSCDPGVIDQLNTPPDPGTAPATPETSKAPDPNCNGFKGQVNGVTVCVPPKASSGIDYLETKQNSDGTTTESKQTTTCQNDKCTTTKSEVTKDSQGNKVSESSVSTDQSKNAYCAKNGTSGQCKGQGEGDGEEEEKGSFSGSCSAGFVCKGDAIQCAAAKEQHKRNCETIEKDTDTNSAINKMLRGDDPQGAEALKADATSIVVEQLDSSGRGWSRSCPPDLVIQLGFVNKSFSVPFSKICPVLKVMSDVALAITMLGLLIWLVVGKKEGK